MNSHLPNHQQFQSPQLVDWSREATTGDSAGGECYLLPYKRRYGDLYDYILLDTGRKGTVKHDIISDMLKKMNNDNEGGVITGVIITHVHADHIGGLTYFSEPDKLSIFCNLQWIAIGTTYMLLDNSKKNPKVVKKLETHISTSFQLKRMKCRGTSISELKEFNDLIMRRIFCDSNGQVVARAWPLGNIQNDGSLHFYCKLPDNEENKIEVNESDNDVIEDSEVVDDKVKNKVVEVEDDEVEVEDSESEDDKVKNNVVEVEVVEVEVVEVEDDEVEVEDSGPEDGGDNSDIDPSCVYASQSQSDPDDDVCSINLPRPKNRKPQSTRGKNRRETGITNAGIDPVNTSSIVTLYMSYPLIVNKELKTKPQYYCFTGDNSFYFSHLLTYGLPHNAEFAAMVLKDIYYNVHIDTPVDEITLQEVYDAAFSIHIHYDFDIMIQAIHNEEDFSAAMKEACVPANAEEAVKAYISKFKDATKDVTLKGRGNKWDAFQLCHHGSFASALGILNYSLFPLEQCNNTPSTTVDKKDLANVYSQVSDLFFVTSPGTLQHISLEFIEMFQDPLLNKTKVLVVYPSLYADPTTDPATDPPSLICKARREFLFSNNKDSPFIVLSSLAQYCFYNFAPILTYTSHERYYDMVQVERHTFLSCKGQQLIRSFIKSTENEDFRKNEEYLKANLAHVEKLKVDILKCKSKVEYQGKSVSFEVKFKDVPIIIKVRNLRELNNLFLYKCLEIELCKTKDATGAPTSTALAVLPPLNHRRHEAMNDATYDAVNDSVVGELEENKTCLHKYKRIRSSHTHSPATHSPRKTRSRSSHRS